MRSSSASSSEHRSTTLAEDEHVAEHEYVVENEHVVEHELFIPSKIRMYIYIYIL